MIPTLSPLNPVALTAFALNVFLAVTVVSLVALIAVRLIFRHNPSARYFLCLIALIAILLSPLLVGIQDRMGFSLVTLSLPESLSPLATSSGLSADSHPWDPAREISPVSNGIAIMVGAFLTLWVAGVVWGTIRLIRGWKEVVCLREGIRPWEETQYSEIRANTERILGCILPPIYTSSRVVSPVAVGLIRPLVILPEGLANALQPVQLQQVLLHECGHVAYKHTLGGVAERIARLFFWMHPLVPALCRELARAREEVCDNVASQENGAACYARTLLALAQGTLPAPILASALALLGPETSLEERISGLLDPRRNRMVRIKQGKLLAVTGVAVLAVLSTVAVRVVAANSDTPPSSEVRMLVLKPVEKDARITKVTAKMQGGVDVVSVEGVPYVLDGKVTAAASPDSKATERINATSGDLYEARIKAVAVPANRAGEPPIVITTEGKAIDVRSDGDGTYLVSADAKPNTPPHHGEEHVRYEVVLKDTPPTHNHAHGIHQFLAHVHQFFGNMFAAFHHAPAEKLDYHVTLDEKAIVKE